MKKKWFFLIIVILIAAASIWVSSISNTNQIPQEPAYHILKWNLGSEPVTLDPQRNTDLYGGSVINHMYEGLLRYENNMLVPAVAEKYDVSLDNMTYTFKLRKTLWSDGSPVTAHDFIYAWKREIGRAHV